ncbi:MAG: pyridoxal phosphate-dependent aminotransferase [Roseovarius sp.]|nr:pyridoxal phosphate-dependent aminotransferase [Roseovarius sp.]
MTPLAPRMTRFKPSASTEASARARALISAGRDIVDLSIGEPDFPTPDNVKDAVARAMANNETHYTNTGGTPAVNAAVRQKFLRDNRLDFAQDEVMASAGAKHAMFNAFMCTVSRGDEVIVPSPFWISYPNQVELAGGTPVIVECGAEDGYKLRAAALGRAITDKTRWVVLNSPNNPTGAVYSRQELREIADVLLEHPGVLVLSDEIYEHFLYEAAAHVSILQVEPMLKDRTVIVNGVSKAYAMTGWRIGCVAAHRDMIKAMSKLQSQSTSCPSSISQAAAVEAFSGPQDAVACMMAQMRRRRELILGILRPINGLVIAPPDGAMYLFCNIEAFLGLKTPKGDVIENDLDFAGHLLSDAGVNVIPGAAYGASGHFRLSFATSDELLKKAGRRIRDACRSLTA